MKNQRNYQDLMIPDLIMALSRSEIDVNELKNLKLELSNWLVKGRDSGDHIH